VLGGRDRVAGRGVDDHHARPRGRLDVDAVDPDARHADDAQARGGGGQKLGIDAGLRADDERVDTAVLGQQVEQLVAADSHAKHGLVRRGKGVDRWLRHRLDDEDAGHGGSLPPPRPRTGPAVNRALNRVQWIDRGRPGARVEERIPT
jgi:hypothetical protein